MIIVLFFYITSLSALAQKNISGTIIYKAVDNFGQPTIVNMFFDNQQSFYVANRGVKERQNILANGEVLDFTNPKAAAEQLQRSNVIYRYFIDEEGDIIYKNWVTNTLEFREVMKHMPFIMKEAQLPVMKWTLTTEKKKIGTFDCQRAITTFRGRNYDAWFTLDIPIPTGPWKLHGLPGLILEANDDKEQFKYTMQSIEMPLKDTSELTKLPKTGERVEFKNYKEFIDRKEKEFNRLTISKAAARGISINLTYSPLDLQELIFE